MINTYAEFWSPSNKYYKQYAFYYAGYKKTDQGSASTFELLSPDGQGKWKIRFAPNETGKWRFRISASDNSSIALYPSSSSFLYFDCVPSSRKGFITAANKRYLKYDSGQAYYPIGNSLPCFFRDPWRGPNEYGTNSIKAGIDEMSANGVNFFRFEINFLEGLNLIGWDFTTNKNYCRFYNQRDAWQLDEIVSYAASKNVNIVFAVFSHAYLGDDGYFTYKGFNYTPVNNNGQTVEPAYSHGAWSQLHPYNANIQPGNEPLTPDSKGDCANPYEFYSKPSAITLQKKLIRYIIARWGYATNLLGLELMDEADRIDVMNKNDKNPNWISPPTNLNQSIISWHQAMTDFIRNHDPYHHLLTTAYSDQNHPTVSSVFKYMDFTQVHRYTDYTIGGWSGNIQEYHYKDAQNYAMQFDLPYMLGEHGYLDHAKLPTLDPHMYELHNNLWSTQLNGSMGAASFWTQFEIGGQNATVIYSGIGKFIKELPQLSETHRPHEEFNYGFRVYYLKDINADECYGWIQDVNYTFRNIFKNYSSYLQNFSAIDRPPLSTGSYTYPISVSRKGMYNVKWYDTETGLLHSTQAVPSLSNQITLTMPAALRKGKYADAGFIVEYQCDSHWNATALFANAPANIRINSPLAVSNNMQVNYIGIDNRIHQMYWNGYYWQWALLNGVAPQNVRADSDLAIDHLNNVYFVGADNRVHQMYWAGDHWQEAALNSSAPSNVRVKSPLAVDHLGKVYFIGADNRVHQYYWDSNASKWQEAVLDNAAPANAMAESDLAIDHLGKVYYVGTDARIHQYYWNVTKWQHAVLNITAPPNVRFQLMSGKTMARSPLAVDPEGSLYFVGNDDRIHIYYWNKSKSHWQEAILNATAPQNVRLNTDLTSDSQGKIYFIAIDDRVHQYYWNVTQWQEATNNVIDPQNVHSGLASDGDNIYFVGEEKRVWGSYWGCNDAFK